MINIYLKESNGKLYHISFETYSTNYDPKCWIHCKTGNLEEHDIVKLIFTQDTCV